MNRRAMLGALASIPVAGKAVAKEISSALAQGSASSGLVGSSSSIVWSAGSSKPATPALQLAAQNPLTRHLLEEMVVNEVRTVHSIDPDIECLKSLSTAAKIYHQRQRNIQKRIDQYVNPTDVWGHGYKKILAALGMES